MSARGKIDTDELVRMFEAGASANEMMARFGVARMTITSQLKKMGLSIRARSIENTLKKNLALAEQARELYAQGLSLSACSKQFGLGECSLGSILADLRDAGHIEQFWGSEPAGLAKKPKTTTVRSGGARVYLNPSKDVVWGLSRKVPTPHGRVRHWVARGCKDLTDDMAAVYRGTVSGLQAAIDKAARAGLGPVWPREIVENEGGGHEDS